jgi:hypothetical protein
MAAVAVAVGVGVAVLVLVVVVVEVVAVSVNNSVNDSYDLIESRVLFINFIIWALVTQWPAKTGCKFDAPVFFKGLRVEHITASLKRQHAPEA